MGHQAPGFVAPELLNYDPDSALLIAQGCPLAFILLDLQHGWACRLNGPDIQPHESRLFRGSLSLATKSNGSVAGHHLWCASVFITKSPKGRK